MCRTLRSPQGFANTSLSPLGGYGALTMKGAPASTCHSIALNLKRSLTWERWGRPIIRRYRRFLQLTNNAEAVIRIRREGEIPDSHPHCMVLVPDTITGWINADRFRQYLGLELTDLLSTGALKSDERSERVLARVRAETGRALFELLREKMAVAMPEHVS